MSIWQTIAAAYQRVFHPREIPFAAESGAPLRPDMSADTAMSALVGNPWVWVCINAISGDLAGLPLRAVKMKGGREFVLPTHPTVQLLKRPAPGCSGLRLRRQIVADFELTGNAYLRNPSPNLLLRMHPGHTTPFANDMGRITHYSYGMAPQAEMIDAAEVLHIAGISWTNKPNEVLGESAVRSLKQDLIAIQLATAHTMKQASRGRPDYLLTPKDSDSAVSPDAVRRIVEMISTALRRDDGVLVIGDGFEATALNLSPRDLEFAKLDERTRDRILSVFGVPPARAGLTSANYGTQKQQMRTYWEDKLKGTGALLDEEFSTLTGDPTVRIEHDASDIESLQVSRTERLMRASTLMSTFGASPADALAFEGFPNAPHGDPGTAPRRPAKEVDEPQRELTASLHTALQASAFRWQARLLATDDPELMAAAAGEEAAYLAGHLEGAGLNQRDASRWAGEISAISTEAMIQVREQTNDADTVRIGIENMSAFGEGRARRLALAITTEAAA